MQSFDGGAYYIAGNLTVRGNFEGSATFVVAGDLIIEGGSVSGSDIDRAYVVGGDVTMAGGSVVTGLIYTDGSITAEGSATVNGGVVALGSGGVSGSLTVNAESVGSINLANATIPDFTVRRWRLVSDWIAVRPATLLYGNGGSWGCRWENRTNGYYRW